MTILTKPMALALLPVAAVTWVAIAAFDTRHDAAKTVAHCAPPEQKACVFRTLAGFESFDTSKISVSTPLIENSIRQGLTWMVQAQHANGGWGAGNHYKQDIRDPHKIPADPATTALTGMALLRTSEKPFDGKYGNALKKAVDYLLNAVNSAPPQASNITSLTNTQPQTKLGKNIDVILTAQFLSNALHYLGNNQPALKRDMEQALNKCVTKIQQSQDDDGGWKDGGWAPVLQSALANNALESAKDMGAKIDEKALERSRNYQKGNYDVKTNSAVTGKAAGVMLYSVSGSARASAKEARKAQDKIDEAKKQGKLKQSDAVSEENLVKAGLTAPEAQKYATAYQIKDAAASRAQDKDVISGFGNNGGEEFISYLMTGESLVIGGNNEWKTWYEQMSGRLVQIQNNDGSWNGHHCITSPVFCTATCLLILSIDKDIEFLIKVK